MLGRGWTNQTAEIWREISRVEVTWFKSQYSPQLSLSLSPWPAAHLASVELCSGRLKFNLTLHRPIRAKSQKFNPSFGSDLILTSEFDFFRDWFMVDVESAEMISSFKAFQTLLLHNILLSFHKINLKVIQDNRFLALMVQWFQCFQTRIAWKIRCESTQKNNNHRYQDNFQCQFSLRVTVTFLNNEIFLMTFHFVKNTYIFLEKGICF